MHLRIRLDQKRLEQHESASFCFESKTTLSLRFLWLGATLAMASSSGTSIASIKQRFSSFNHFDKEHALGPLAMGLFPSGHLFGTRPYLIELLISYRTVSILGLANLR